VSQGGRAPAALAPRQTFTPQVRRRAVRFMYCSRAYVARCCQYRFTDAPWGCLPSHHLVSSRWK